MKKRDERVIAVIFVYFMTYFGPVFMMTFTSSYMTDILNYSAYETSTALLLARIFDALVSTFAGPILQKFNPGKKNKDKLSNWAAFLGIGSFITLLLVFVNSTVIGTMGFWINALWYALFSGINDLLTGVNFSMLGEMSRTDQEIRNEMAIASSRTAKITGIISGFLTLPLLNFFGRICPGWNYTIVAGIFGFSTMMGMLGYRRIYNKNVNPEEKTRDGNDSEQIKLSTLYKSLIKNDALRAINIADIFYYSGAYVFFGLTVYYFKLMGDFNNTYSLINGIIGTAGVVGAIFMPAFGLKLGKKKSKAVWFFLYSFMTIGLGLIGQQSVWIYAFVMGAGQILFNLWFFYQGIYLLDAAEYYLYKTGIDTRIAAPATCQLANDIGGAIGGAIAGYGIALCGYDRIDIATLSNVTPEFMHRFMFLFVIGGLLLLIGAILWMKFYKITDEEIEMYRRENEKKRM